MSARKKKHTDQCQAYEAAIKRRGRNPRPGDEAVIALGRGRGCSKSHSGARRESTPREATMSAPVAPPDSKPKKPKVSTRRSVDRPAAPPPLSASTDAPTFMGAIASTIDWAFVCALLAGSVVGKWIIDVGGWLYMAPGEFHGYSMGVAAAGAFIAADLMVGHHALKRWMAGQRDGWTYALIVTLVCLGAFDAMVAQMRNKAAISTGVESALKAVRPVAACPAETMPKNVYGYKQIDSWQAGATARHKACLDAQTTQQKTQTDGLVANAKDRDWWERPALTFGAVILTFAIGGSAAAFTHFVHALLSIPAAALASIRRAFGWDKEAPAPVPARAPIPTPEPDPAPAKREGLWARLSRKLPYGPFKPRQAAS